VCSCDDVITAAELHVQVNNVQAIRFYNRHAFSTVKVVKGYYARLEASDAVLLRRPLQKAAKEGDTE
jgi:ribosomal protein S18 acetylase RimI-like enzyme